MRSRLRPFRIRHQRILVAAGFVAFRNHTACHAPFLKIGMAAWSLAFWDDSAPPPGRSNAHGSTIATSRNGRPAQQYPDASSSAGPLIDLHHQEPAHQAAYSSESPQHRNRTGSRQSTVSMDSMDYEGNDPWQQVPQHLAGDHGDHAASDTADEAHWDADEQFDATPEAEWGRRSRWSAANMEQGFNDPFHNPKWDRYEDEPEVAQQSGSSWDEGEASVLSGREPRVRTPQDWDWVSPAEARRRKQLQEVEIAELVESAIEASDAGDPQAALRLLLDARRLSPKDPFLLMRLGVLLGRMGEADKALVALDQAYSIEHNDAQILKYRGIALAAVGKHQEAVYAFNHAHDLQPSDAEVLKLRAVTYGEMGQIGLRMADLNTAITLDSNNADLYRTRGIAHRMVKDDSASLADFTEAIRLAPGVSQLHLERAGTAIRLHDYDLAMEDLQTAEQLEPQQVNTIWDLALVLDRQNAPEQALKLFDWANTLDANNPIILRRRAFCRSKLKDFRGAVQDLEAAVAVAPRNPYLLKDLGFNRWQAGDRAGASDVLAKAAQLLPQDKAISRLQYSVANYKSRGVRHRRPGNQQN
ncbi:hypothetical protein WJX74_002790 [Apatococcus lobatus]|uniref:Tetratricopeptide repeat protein n=1 Tax=Apatococcus lobatus TaxID=904363 RepID=A0AAW1QVE8_9CHLO